MKRDLDLIRWAGIALVSLLFGLALLAFSGGESSAAAQAQNPLRVIESNTSHVVLELSLSSYDVRTNRTGGTTYSIVSAFDLDHTGDPGKPQLPMAGALVGIPPGAQPSLKIITDQSRMDSLTNPPLPVSTPRIDFDPRKPQSVSRTDNLTPNALTYSANQFYPHVAATIGSTGNWRSQHYASVQFYPFQYNPATHQLVFHQRLRVEIIFSYPRGPTQQALGGPVSEGPFETVLQNSIINYASAKNWRSRILPAGPSAKAPTANNTACPYETPCYRVGVNTDGIYQLTCDQLATAAGVDSLNIVSSTLQVFKQGTELRINVVGNGWSNCTSGDTNDYVEFFGQGPENKDPDIKFKYSNTNNYWLTYGNATGKRMLTRDGSISGGTPAQTFTNTLHLEQHQFYSSYTPLTENFEHWFWDYLAPYQNRNQQTVSFPSPHLAPGSLTAILKIDLAGYSAGLHHTTISLNSCNSIYDTPAGWGPGKIELSPTITFPQTCLVTTTNNTLNVVEKNDLDYTDFIYTKFYDISYPSTFDAVTDTISFQQPASGTWAYTINGFSGSNIETFAFDSADPYDVAQVITPPPTLNGSSYTLQFNDAIASPNQYIALTPAQRLSPVSVTLRVPPSNPTSLVCSSSPCDSSHFADYIIIANSAFMSDAKLQQLATTRANQGLRVKLIDVQNVYDEFSDGVVDAQAIHDFLQYAYSNWNQQANPNTPPSYVLLVGGGNYDPKGYCVPPATCLNTYFKTPPNSTLIPPYLRMVDPLGYQETASDSQLVAFGGPQTLPEMSIGRLPADTPADVDALVTKILNYENPPMGTWRSTVSFVTDSAYNPDGTVNRGGDFWYYSEQIAGNPTYFPTGLLANRIYLNVCPSCTPPFTPPNPPYTTGASAKAATISAINKGRLIVNYIGHGAISQWGDYDQFDIGDLPTLTNGSKTPVMLELTCNTGYFIYPSSSTINPFAQSLAKLNVNVSGNGAVASWAAAGFGFVAGHDALEKGFFNAVMNNDVLRLGDAILAGKANLLASGGNLDLIDTTLLFGDPASRLPIQFLYYLPAIERQ